MTTLSHLTIITGASRGLGHAIAQALLKRPDQHLVCISRRTDEALSTFAHEHGSVLEQWPHDLSDSLTVAHRLVEWLQAIDHSRFASATLVNNAGVMAPPRPLANANLTDLMQSVRVGLEAPMLLTSAFLNGTRHWSGQRKLLHISSGLGSVARGGQAPYCAVKAGLDHFSRALALENSLPNSARSVSLSPGIVDTDMQAELRSANPLEFPEVSRFQMLKTQGLLDSPEDSANKVLAWLDREDFGAEPVVDLMKK